MNSLGFEVEPIAGSIGAEIHGLDISQELADDTIAGIRQALLDHCVIFFRDQKLDEEQHKAFARRFGSFFIHPNIIGSTSDPAVINLVREPGEKKIIGEYWHTDTTMVAEPPMGAILYAVSVPAHGGDTLFANQYLAYETLSPGLQRVLADLKCVHTDRSLAGPTLGLNATRATKVREDSGWKESASVHPAVRTHPETGRKALFVNPMQTVAFEGMTEAESAPLLRYLFDHGHREEFTCRFRWRNGSVAFWDNRCAHHIAVNDAGPHRRVMRRIQLAGDRPI